tara:strand:- start:205 stop:486 length:282 start_codon:yes stop_codon:yes gene_type:complete
MMYQEIINNKHKALEILIARSGVDIDKKQLIKNKKREKFNRLANKRVRNGIKSLKLIQNLSNKSKYLYTEKEYKEIIQELDKLFVNLRKKFRK